MVGTIQVVHIRGGYKKNVEPSIERVERGL